MFSKLKTSLFIALLGLFLPFHGVFALEPALNVRLNNENWFTAPHPEVTSFTVHADGSASGLTEGGIPFVQYNVQNEFGVRIQRFEIQDHYHYIVDGQIAYTPEELSVELAKALGQQNP